MRRRTPSTIFAFRIHQFLSKGDNIYSILAEQRFITGHTSLPSSSTPVSPTMIPLVFVASVARNT